MLPVKHVLTITTFVVASLAQLAFSSLYELALSKEDALCNYMLRVLNGDMQKYGELKYEKHPELDAIKWTTVREDYCSLIRMAKFDMNNDGYDDVVVKQEACLRGVLSDILYVYDKGQDAPQYPPPFEFNAAMVKKSSGQIGGFSQGTYYLKEISKFKTDSSEYFHYISGIFKLNPFVFEGKKYILMDNPLQKEDGGGRKYLAIVLYEQGKELKDICYFEKEKDLPKSGQNKQRKNSGR